MPEPLQQQRSLDNSEIVCRAFFRAADDLGHSRVYLEKLLNKTGNTISNLRSGKSSLRGTEQELALLYLRIYRSLSALMGGNLDQCKAWLEAENHALGDSPKEMITSIEGLVHVVDYLDSMRG